MNLPAYDRSRAFGEVVHAHGGRPLRLAVALDPAFAASPSAHLLVLALANVLPRISERYAAIDFCVPRVSIKIPRVQGEDVGKYVTDYAAQICPWGTFRQRDLPRGEYDYAIVVGNAPHVIARRTLHVMASGWRCFVLFRPGDFGRVEQFNPFGCLGTASLASMMLYREAEQVDELVLHAEVKGWSLLNFELTADDGPPLPDSIEVGQIIQAGLGGTGNALLWALRYGPNLRGCWRAYEHECLDITNLNRYLLMLATDEQMSKCELTAREFANFHPALDFKPIESSVALAYSQVFTADTILATVDDPRIRVDLQQHGASVLLNVGTNSQYLSMSRHEIARIRQGDPCVECFYGKPDRMERRQRESTLSFVTGLIGSALGGELVKNYAFRDQVLANSWVANIFSATSGRVLLRGSSAVCGTCQTIRGE